MGWARTWASMGRTWGECGVGGWHSGALGDGHSEPPILLPKSHPFPDTCHALGRGDGRGCGDSNEASVTHGGSCTLACSGPGSSVPQVSPSCPEALPHATHVPMSLEFPCHSCPLAVLQHCPMSLMFPCPWSSHVTHVPCCPAVIPTRVGSRTLQMKPMLSLLSLAGGCACDTCACPRRSCQWR